jgi:hypothetical protein
MYCGAELEPKGKIIKNQNNKIRKHTLIPKSTEELGRFELTWVWSG